MLKVIQNLSLMSSSNGIIKSDGIAAFDYSGAFDTRKLLRWECFEHNSQLLTLRTKPYVYCFLSADDFEHGTQEMLPNPSTKRHMIDRRHESPCPRPSACSNLLPADLRSDGRTMVGSRPT